MSSAQLSIIIESLLSLVVLFAVVFALWPAQREDLFRQQMFALRDELFDFASEGNISFEEPAYVLLRQLMNGFIRYAHNLTPYRTFMAFLRWKYVSHDPLTTWSEPWDAALNNVKDQDVKNKLLEFHATTAILVVKQLTFSPGSLAFLFPFIMLGRFRHQLKNLYSFLQRQLPISLLEEEAARS